jgi:polysaccharide biosynthesis protein PslH
LWSAGARPIAALVLPEPPFPEDSGNSLRDAQQIELLGRLGYEVILICVRPRLPGRQDGSGAGGGRRRPRTIFLSEETLPEVETKAQMIGKKLSYLLAGNRSHPFGWWLDFYSVSSALPEVLRRLQPSLLVVRSIFIGFLRAVREVFAGPLILDCHDDDVHLAREMVRSVPFTGKLGPWANLVGVTRSVRHGLPLADEIWAVSQGDAEGLARFSGGRPVLVVPSGVDEGALSVAPSPGADGRCALIANFSYGPNLIGARWLVEKAWPAVRRLAPGAELLLVGGGREREVTALAREDTGIRALGRIPSLEAVYAEAGVILAPLLQGGGSRLKVVEAWRYGKAVLGTTKGIEGLDAPPSACVRADSPEEFGHALAGLMNDPARRRSLGQGGLEFVGRWLTYRIIEGKLRAASVAGGGVA